MEFPEHPERIARPELNEDDPTHIFDYARQMLAYYRARVSSGQLPVAVDALCRSLDSLVEEYFDDAPVLTVQTRDVYRIRSIRQELGTHTIETGPLPLRGDGELYGEHTIQGKLHGFHRGEHDELRVYLSNNDEPYRFMGGVITRLTSVAVEGSDINFMERNVEEQLEALELAIGQQVAEYSAQHDTQVLDLYVAGIKHVLQGRDPAAEKLVKSSQILSAVSRMADIPDQLIDALITTTKLRLRLYMPQRIKAKSHDAVISRRPISYKPIAGTVIFDNVTPDLALIGETERRRLGLLFLYKDEQPIQVPVEHILTIHTTER